MARAGKYDRRVTLLTVSRTPDATGQGVETFTEGATLWCQRLDVLGSERLQAAQVDGGVSAKFTLRWRSGITPDMRLRCEGVDYEIVGPPIEIGRREQLQLLARALVAASS